MGWVLQGGHRALAAPRGPRQPGAGMGTAVAEPCPRRVPQRCAGTTGASDSSGGRARHGTGTAREDEPVQAWPQLVSPARLRCLTHPSLRLSPPFPPRLSHRAALLGEAGTVRSLPTPQLVSGNMFSSETIADGFWSGAGPEQPILVAVELSPNPESSSEQEHPGVGLGGFVSRVHLGSRRKGETLPIFALPTLLSLSQPLRVCTRWESCWASPWVLL